MTNMIQTFAAVVKKMKKDNAANNYNINATNTLLRRLCKSFLLTVYSIDKSVLRSPLTLMPPVFLSKLKNVGAGGTPMGMYTIWPCKMNQSNYSTIDLKGYAAPSYFITKHKIGR